MHGNHWSLILFTLLAQASAGTMVLGTFFRSVSRISGRPALPQSAFRRGLFIAAAAMIAAALISFFHLGTPLHAIYVLNNLASSWLSREILAVILFTGSVCLVALLHILGTKREGLLHFLESSSAILGLILVFSMSRIYMLPTVPIWNHLFTPLTFFGTMFLIGAATWMLIMGYYREFAASPVNVIGNLCVGFGAFQLTILVLHTLYISGLTTGLNESWMIGLRFFLLLVGTLMAAKVDRDSDHRLLILMFVVFTAAELLGRFQFYAGYSRIGI